MDHMYADCPRNPKRRCMGKNRQKGQKACTRPQAQVVGTSATVEEVQSEEEEKEASKEKEAPPTYSKKKLMAAIKTLSTEECEDLLDAAALDSDQDF
jgi:hypothetical protein